MKRALILSGILAASFASADITGKWVGTMQPPGGPKGAKVVMQGGATYALTIEKGGKYTMVVTNKGKNNPPTVGTWKLNGSNLTLTPSAESIKRNPSLKERVLKVAKGETKLTAEIQAHLSVGPVKVENGKISEKQKAELLEQAKKSTKSQTIVIEFKRA